MNDNKPHTFEDSIREIREIRESMEEQRRLEKRRPKEKALDRIQKLISDYESGKTDEAEIDERFDRIAFEIWKVTKGG